MRLLVKKGHECVSNVNSSCTWVEVVLAKRTPHRTVHGLREFWRTQHADRSSGTSDTSTSSLFNRHLHLPFNLCSTTTLALLNP